MDIILTCEFMSNEMTSSSSTNHCSVAFDHVENVVKPAWPVGPLITLSCVITMIHCILHYTVLVETDHYKTIKTH
jgi:hypothetical protein